MSEVTFVTGCWDIGRGNLDNTSSNHDWKRSFNTYTDRLEELLATGLPIIVFGDEILKKIVDKYSNCHFILFSQDNFYNTPYFKRIDSIRTSPKWYDQPTAKWLKSSPQATLPLYVPIQLNKMFCIKKAIQENIFHSNRFYWIDAGITKTHDTQLIKSMIPNLLKYNNFLFMSHLYRDNTEIHGFLREGVHKHCNMQFVERIMKGFFFGGKVDKFDEIMVLYHNIIDKTLDEGYLGCDETYHTIMAYQWPDLFDKIIIPHCFNTMNSL
jgi:hypothetical protein